MERVATAPGKLLLFGEHAAVYGFPAIGMALPLAVTLRYRPSEQGASEHGVPDGEELHLGRLTIHGIPSRFHDAVAALFDRLHALSAGDDVPPDMKDIAQEIALFEGSLTFQTEIPMSAGFGSSGAVCAALAALALGQDQGPAETSQPLRGGASEAAGAALHRRWRLAHELERVFHGTPSGVDTGLATYGDTRYFFTDRAGELQSALPRALELDDPKWTILVGALPRTGDTKGLVGGIRDAWQAGDAATRAHIGTLGEIAEAAAQLLGHRRLSRSGASEPQGQPEHPRGTDPEDLPELANRAHESLRALALSTDELDGALRVGFEHGARGGKVSGAGGGGAFYLLFDERDRAERAVTELRETLGNRLLSAFIV
jgi:mevalonate kinase